MPSELTQGFGSLDPPPQHTLFPLQTQQPAPSRPERALLLGLDL